MRVPWPAATMMALFIGLQVAGFFLCVLCVLCGSFPSAIANVLHAGRQSNNFNCSDLDPLYSLICGTKARSKFPAGNGALSQFQQTTSHTFRPSVIHSFACWWSRPMRCGGRCSETLRTAS